MTTPLTNNLSEEEWAKAAAAAEAMVDPCDGSVEGGRGSLIDLDGSNVPTEGSTPVLRLKEVIQAGDIFLVSFDCLDCGSPCLTNFRSADCSVCGADYTDIPVEVPQARSHRRLVVGTYRKPGGGLGKKQLRNLLDQQGHECGYCGVTLGSDFHIEHIIPLCVGGTNNLSNLCISCPQCNLTAGPLVFQDFYQKQQYIIAKRFKKRIIQ